MFNISRSKNNPILSPTSEHPWESEAVFNGCPVNDGKTTHLVYRAMSARDMMEENHMKTSVVGIATLDKDGQYGNRRKLIVPDQVFDQFGCEDPRVTKIGDKYYIFYTALGGYPFSAENIKVAVAVSKDLHTIESKHLVTPFNAKAMTLFPKKVNGKYRALLTINTDIGPSEVCFADFEKLEDMWSPEFWDEWRRNVSIYKINIRRTPEDQIEVGAPPIETKSGWLLIYSHIQKYGHPDQVFGIEALVLSKKDGKTIISRTDGPFLAPEEHYEKIGQIPNITFPSGALLNKKELEIYYGGADTYCAKATINLDSLLSYMSLKERSLFKRYKGNPILTPREGLTWEQGGTFNPASIQIGSKTHILYRAFSNENISTIGYASSKDGYKIDERLNEPIYKPRIPLENRGCEDARIVEMEGMLYMTYTAYDGILPRVALSKISVNDFNKKNWGCWSLPQIITPMNVDNKDCVIFPEKINDKYLIIHRIKDTLCADYVDSLDFELNKVKKCIEMIHPRRGMWDGDKVGVAGPPIKTKDGWVLFYHGVSWSKIYRVGAVLLDLNDPTVVLSRTATPIFEPREDYEKFGVVPNVVFPCGHVIKKGKIYMYYGGADKVVGVATTNLKDLIKILKP